MATAFEQLIAALREYCDAAAAGSDQNLDLRVGYGTPGYRIEVRNETQDTGQCYTKLDAHGNKKDTTGIIQGVLWAVSQVAGTGTNVFHSNVSGEFAALTAKPSTVDADLLVIEDSAAGYAKKKISIATLMLNWLTPVGPIQQTTYEASYGELATMRGG